MDNEFYVYLHRRATDNKVFYVGKGKKKRAWDFSSRNRHWNSVKEKHGVVVEIVFDNLCEEDAFDIEVDTIKEMRYLFQKYMTNVASGGRTILCADREGSDKSVYKFISKDGDLLETTKFEFRKITGFSLSTTTKIVNNKFHTLKGWGVLRENETLEQGVYRLNNSLSDKRKDTTIYRFIHMYTRDIVSSTRSDFAKMINVSDAHLGNLFSSGKTRSSSVFNWGILLDDDVDKNIRRLLSDKNLDCNVYKFYKEGVGYFVGTRYDLMYEFKIPNASVNALFTRRTTAYGWSLIKEKHE